MNSNFPKFRAWVKSEVGGEWFMSYPRWIDLENKRICTESGLQPKEFILIPYTGLTDEYGVKAYRHDVVSAMGHSNWVIDWHNNGWKLKQIDSDHYRDIPNEFVIIGNIFIVIGNNSEIYREVANGG